MGFFSELFSKKPANPVTINGTAEAIYCICYAVAVVDGRASESEYRILRDILAIDPVFKGANWTQLHQDAKEKDLLAGNTGALVTIAVPHLDLDSRLITFAYAVDITLSDGELGDRELDLLQSLSKELELSGDVTEAVIKTLIYKFKANQQHRLS